MLVLGPLPPLVPFPSLRLLSPLARLLVPLPPSLRVSPSAPAPARTQDVALIDVKRGVQTFNLLRVPILGMVENMSHHVCGACGHKEHTFGRGGVEALAAEYGLPLLGQVG